MIQRAVLAYSDITLEGREGYIFLAQAMRGSTVSIFLFLLEAFLLASLISLNRSLRLMMSIATLEVEGGDEYKIDYGTLIHHRTPLIAIELASMFMGIVTTLAVYVAVALSLTQILLSILIFRGVKGMWIWKTFSYAVTDM